MLQIIKILTSFANLIGDVKNLKNAEGKIDPAKVEALLNDVLTDAEQVVPADTVLFEKIKVAIDSAIEAILEAENPSTKNV